MSHNHVLNKPILTMIKEHEDNIHSILDVACGYGQYGLLLRIVNHYRGFIAGFDLYKPYIDRLSRLTIYDNLWLDDVRKWINSHNMGLDMFDLIIVGDLIEHLDKEDGLKVIEKMKEAKRVIITTPYNDTTHFKKHTGYWDGNDTMFHISGYTPDEFKDYNIELINLLHIPRQLKIVYKVREILTGKPIADKEIIAHRGFND